MKSVRENYLSLVRRQGYEFVPINFSLCPYLEEKYKKDVCNNMSYLEKFKFSYLSVEDMKLKNNDTSVFKKYFDERRALL